MKLLSLTIPNAQGTPVQVQAPSGIPTGGLEAGGAGQRIVQLSIEILILGAIIIALFFLISAGWTWMTSEGDKTAVQSARNKLVYAIIGLVVIFLAMFIVNIVGYFFGVPLIHPGDTFPIFGGGSNN